MLSSVDRFFGLSANGTNLSREVTAGLTTFLAMAYITVVNPLILSDAGMDFGAVFVATCLAAALGSLVMGLVANYPIGLAPGMGPVSASSDIPLGRTSSRTLPSCMS